jgi:hypothetical protein
MDFVNKYEGRTLWSSSGSDLVSKFGATTIILRARPAGTSSLIYHIHQLISRIRSNGPTYHSSSPHLGRHQRLLSND